ncbi:hypothetical protein B0H13DRAFT_1127647 [Mycena leptocephala]|nr:hypothetical protein B0H13DRAFT_1127647 [Mycena leptocephala]
MMSSFGNGVWFWYEGCWLWPCRQHDLCPPVSSSPSWRRQSLPRPHGIPRPQATRYPALSPRAPHARKAPTPTGTDADKAHTPTGPDARKAPHYLPLLASASPISCAGARLPPSPSLYPAFMAPDAHPHPTPTRHRRPRGNSDSSRQFYLFCSFI